VGSQHPELFNKSRALDRERSARGRQENRARQCVSLPALFAVAFDDRAGSAGGCEGGFMSDHERKQREYEAKRPKLTEQYPTIAYRVFLPDGSEKIERAIGLSQIAAYYPDAVMIQRCDVAGFW
jgi:hypothetical protein